MSEKRGGPWERLAGAFRRRQIRDVMELDRRGRLGEPPRPGLLAFATFVLVGALGFLTFTVGRVEEDTIYLVIAAIGVFGLAISIGVPLGASACRRAAYIFCTSATETPFFLATH